jgi:PKD repeat protein
MNGSTLTHEVGHYLGLYHTHETAFGEEAVNGSDCLYEGDLLCDTPADPRLGTNIDGGGCVYIGNETDENGNSYTPHVSNIMSYSRKECRFEFTEDQQDKVMWTLENERSYLFCSTPQLEAFFYIPERINCDNSKTFNFYNASKGDVIENIWSFGDGTSTSNIESPQHTYSENGIYEAILTTTDGTTTSSYSKRITVGEVTLPYFNNFEDETLSLVDFNTHQTMRNQVAIDSTMAKSGIYSLLFDGTEKSSSSPTYHASSSSAFQPLWNPHYQAKAQLCVDATLYTNLTLKFYKKQYVSEKNSNTNFRVSVDGVIVGEVYHANSNGNDDSEFVEVVVDLSPYTGKVFSLGFEGSHMFNKDYAGLNNGTMTFIDNIELSSSGLGLVDKNLRAIKLYPNPSQDFIHILGEDLERASITNLIGEDVTYMTGIEKIGHIALKIEINKTDTHTLKFTKL